MLLAGQLAQAAPAEELRGTSVLVSPPAELSALTDTDPQHRILYVHGTGGSYVPGWDDSARNTSSILANTATIPPARLSPSEWEELMSCVRQAYEPFAIAVTDVEPPPEIDYIEGVVGGKPGDAGFPRNVAGVAPMMSDCSVIERAVTYTFSDQFYSPLSKAHSMEHVCWTFIQESGHVLGLDHVLHCPDPMTYLDGCGPKAFRDLDAACGEDTERSCRCGGSTQNSVQHMLAVLGPADRVPPTVELVTPSDGDLVPPRFTIEASCEDLIEVDGSLVAGRIDRVELWMGGELVDVSGAAPYSFEAPASLTAGVHEVEVRAYDGHQNVASASAVITLEAECAADVDCPLGATCDGTVCDAPAASDAPEGEPEFVLDDRGGGCAAAGVAGSAGSLGGAALALMAVLVWRRRPLSGLRSGR